MASKILEVILPSFLTFAGLYFAVFLAIVADLIAGWRKAKKDGFIRSSKGLRRTVSKIGKYFNMMFVVSIIDIVQMVAIWQGGFDIVKMPFLSFGATIFLLLIELKSIYEKNTDKEKADIEDMAKFIIKAAKDKDAQHVISALLEGVKEKDNGD